MEKKKNSLAGPETSGIKFNGINNFNVKFKILICLIFFIIIILLTAITFDTFQEVPLARSFQNKYAEKMVLISGKPTTKATRAVTATPTIDRTNWKIYKSKSGFFSFRYPSLFIVQEDDNQLSLNDKKYLNYTISFKNALEKNLRKILFLTSTQRNLILWLQKPIMQT